MSSLEVFDQFKQTKIHFSRYASTQILLCDFCRIRRVKWHIQFQEGCPKPDGFCCDVCLVDRLNAAMNYVGTNEFIVRYKFEV
jgi:hypothetical protein